MKFQQLMSFIILTFMKTNFTDRPLAYYIKYNVTTEEEEKFCH